MESSQPINKEDLIRHLDKESGYLDFVTRNSLTIGQVLFCSNEKYKKLFEMAKQAEPMGPFGSKRLYFTRQLDKLYDNGDRALGTYWQEFKTEIGSEDKAYKILVQSGEFPELAEKYKR